MNFRAKVTASCAGILMFAATVSVSWAATNVWIGPVGGNLNWSSVFNWSLGAVPNAGDTAKFAGAGQPNARPTNSIVDEVFGNSINGLQLQTQFGNFGILVPSGQILSVVGGLTCGTNGSASVTNFFMGEGTLVVSNSPATNEIIVGNWAFPGPPPALAFGLISPSVLDLSGLDNFAATVARVRVADGLAYGTPEHINAKGNLILARTNLIVAADIAVGVAGYTNPYSYSGGNPVFFVLGQSNGVCADRITVGRDYMLSRMVFNSLYGNSWARFRGRDGTNRVTEFTIGDGWNGNDRFYPTNQSYVDFSSGTVDLQVSTLLIGGVRTNIGSRSGDGLARGKLRFARGRVEVNTLQLGRSMWELAGCAAEGRIEVVSPGELVVSDSIEMGKKNASARASGIISIEGGRVVTTVINADYNSRSNAIYLTNGTLIVSNTMGPGILNFVMVDSTLQLPATLAPSAMITNLVTGGTSNIINIGSIVGLYSYPTQVSLIKYQGAIGGAGFNFLLGSLPQPGHLGFLFNNTVNSSVDVILDMAPKLAASALGDQLALILIGPSNRVVDVLTSTNLSEWRLLTTVTNTSGVATMLDSTTNSPQQFFRARQWP
jgi:hypothetical protein